MKFIELPPADQFIIVFCIVNLISLAISIFFLKYTHAKKKDIEKDEDMD